MGMTQEDIGVDFDGRPLLLSHTDTSSETTADTCVFIERTGGPSEERSVDHDDDDESRRSRHTVTTPASRCQPDQSSEEMGGYRVADPR